MVAPGVEVSAAYVRFADPVGERHSNDRLRLRGRDLEFSVDDRIAVVLAIHGDQPIDSFHSFEGQGDPPRPRKSDRIFDDHLILHAVLIQ